MPMSLFCVSGVKWEWNWNWQWGELRFESYMIEKRFARGTIRAYLIDQSFSGLGNFSFAMRERLSGPLSEYTGDMTHQDVGKCIFHHFPNPSFGRGHHSNKSDVGNVYFKHSKAFDWMPERWQTCNYPGGYVLRFPLRYWCSLVVLHSPKELAAFTASH